MVDPNSLNEEDIRELQNDPLFSEIMTKIMKERWSDQHLRSLDTMTLYLTVKSLMMSSAVADPERDMYLDRDRCSEIYQKVKEDFENEEVSDDLIETYKKNLRPLKDQAEKWKTDLRKEIFGKKYEEIEELRVSDRKDKEEAINRIEEDHQHSRNEELWDEIDEIESKISHISQFPYSVEQIKEDPPTANGDPNHFLKHCAVRIYKPNLYSQLYVHEAEYEDYPLKWVPAPVCEDRLAYGAFKQGEMPEAVITGRVNSEGYLDELLSDVEIVPPFRQRTDLIEEVVANYRDERYASVINLILPQIEFLMWKYAAHLDSNRNVDILIDADYTDPWELNIREEDDMKLVNIDGDPLEEYPIRDLVQQTALREHLNPDIVQYFVNELFEERNPILHGNLSDYHTELEAAKKILFFEHILSQLIDSIGDHYTERAKEMDEFDEIDVPMEYMTADE
ncbi:hypothetical protein [Halococcus sp. AFM35]|uniref:hypothetical protein n=1 Tax=Halococcus sp. AFM35 TaxID=3421653 RepID=UPI003EC11B7B